MRFPLPEGPVHGDAHVQNLIITAGGPVFIDFERFAWGHPEWDLSMTATEYQTAGWWTSCEVADEVAAAEVKFPGRLPPGWRGGQDGAGQPWEIHGRRGIERPGLTSVGCCRAPKKHPISCQ